MASIAVLASAPASRSGSPEARVGEGYSSRNAVLGPFGSSPPTLSMTRADVLLTTCLDALRLVEICHTADRMAERNLRTFVPDNGFRPEMQTVSQTCAEALFDGYGGSARLEFTVGESGVAESPTIVEDATGAPDFADCIVEGLRATVFEPPPEHIDEDGWPMTDQVPLRFSAEI